VIATLADRSFFLIKKHILMNFFFFKASKSGIEVMATGITAIVVGFIAVFALAVVLWAKLP
jgi:hypothetical protein